MACMTHVADAKGLPLHAIACVDAYGGVDGDVNGHVNGGEGELVRRVRLLAAIANFAALRRTMGCGAAEQLAGAMARRIVDGLPGVAARPIARDIVEITFDSSEPDAVALASASVRVLFEVPLDPAGQGGVPILVLGGATGAPDGDEVLLAESAEAALARARRFHTDCEGAVEVSERDRLAIELDRAIERDELMLMYQPKVQVRRQAITSAEALIRWRHPERGMVLPGDFIPAAEQAQLIDRLTLWTVSRAIRDQRTLRQMGHELRLFINISGQLLADPRFVAEVCALVQAAPDTSIGFEVTETSVIRDPAVAIANLKRFDEIGIYISIDDYGAGLSSLAYLKQLPARELKIDKLFITQLTSSHRDPLIVRSTIDLAHALDMEVVAEGVETAAALALLSVMGCDQVQGYFISYPVPLDGLVEFLRDDTRRLAPESSRTSFLRLASAWKRA